MTAEPLVDVVIPVHSALRPIARAVASIVDHTAAPIRVSVVAHNIDASVIRTNLGVYADHKSVRLLTLQDDIRSPAGPMNYGLDAATARFVSVMGSDDTFAPGALDSWLQLQRRTGATVVIARIAVQSRGGDPYPPVRRGRRSTGLDAVRDRLLYRSAPLGLVDRQAFPDLRFTEGLASGEDLAFSATLWFTGRVLAYDLTGPAYTIHEDAEDRVTFTPRPVTEDFAFLDALEAEPWFAGLNTAERTALTVKILRIHFFDAIQARLTGEVTLERAIPELLEVIGRLHAWAPGSFALLSRADMQVFKHLRSPAPKRSELHRLLDARRSYRTLPAIVTANPLLVLHQQAPLRTLWAGLRSMSATSPK